MLTRSTIIWTHWVCLRTALHFNAPKNPSKTIPGNLSWNVTHRGKYPWIPVVHLPLFNTTYLPQILNDCIAHFCRGRTIRDVILETIDLPHGVVSVPLLGGTEKDKPPGRYRYRHVDNWGYYGYLCGDTCHGPRCDVDDDPSPDSLAEWSVCGLSSDL